MNANGDEGDHNSKRIVSINNVYRLPTHDFTG